MQRVSNQRSSCPADLRQHFQNYFELLFGAECSRLQQAVSKGAPESEQHDLLNEIDCRINYLRGAVRMGNLLCLIDQEEVKANLGRLTSERDRLRASAIGAETCMRQEVADQSARLDSIRKSLQPAAR